MADRLTRAPSETDGLVRIEARDIDLRSRLEREVSLLQGAVQRSRKSPSPIEVGTVRAIGFGTAIADGLPHVRNEELVELPGRLPGLVFDLAPESVGLILLGNYDELRAGDQVRRTHRVLDFPVGKELLGRVVDPTGMPADERGAVRLSDRRAIEQTAPSIFERAPVDTPLQTGIRVIDALFPIGRGQRELIVGDRQTGKTSIALNAIMNQRATGVVCIYCAIGKRGSAISRAIDQLHSHGAMDYTVVIATSGHDPPGLLFVAPFAAMTLAEHFMRDGRDVLVVYDDLTQHARAYREISLLLRRPPGREAYPGDIFYLHSRLLERSTHLREEFGGGSITALPIVETYAQNISDYIPTNLISITDGQIYLSPVLFRQGQLPAVDIGRSVSRVGGKAQLPAYRMVAGPLRLAYTQFEELESFTRFGTQLDRETRETLEHGRRIRAVFRQPEFDTIPIAEQLATLTAANEGFFDDLPEELVEVASEHIREQMRGRLEDLCERIEAGERLSDDEQRSLMETVGTLVREVADRHDGNP